MLFIQILIVGIVSCAIFDLWQRVLQKLIATPPSNWAMVGRWALGLLTNGQLIACDLESQAERKMNWQLAGLFIIASRLGMRQSMRGLCMSLYCGQG